MKMIDLYTPFKEAIQSRRDGYELFSENPEFQFLEPLARSWEMNTKSARRWMNSADARNQAAHADAYLKISKATVGQVERAFGSELPGVLVFMPSFGEFDGFARYDSGSHTVLFGVDLPGSSVDYMRALTAHELSHVYRDHAPEVWAHLGKPLSQISRREYLDGATAQEHLVSEGIATLFSQVLFPEIDPRLHHYYEEDEWRWCIENDALIEEAFLECLRGDEDVWSFYSPSRVANGSPSRTQYYWAAKKLASRIQGVPDRLAEAVRLHTLHAGKFTEFVLKP